MQTLDYIELYLWRDVDDSEELELFLIGKSNATR